MKEALILKGQFTIIHCDHIVAVIYYSKLNDIYCFIELTISRCRGHQVEIRIISLSCTTTSVSPDGDESCSR